MFSTSLIYDQLWVVLVTFYIGNHIFGISFLNLTRTNKNSFTKFIFLVAFHVFLLLFLHAVLLITSI